MNAEALATRLRGALHPLEAPPVGEPWNLAELDGLLSPGEPHAAAVLVGVIPRVDGASVLLTRRNEALRHHGGQVSFPGGRVEPGDASPLHAALREAAEDTQFIVITHNRGTIEAADTIYGISMGSDSVSQALSLHLEEMDGQRELVPD